jgi:hypothetical protein
VTGAAELEPYAVALTIVAGPAGLEPGDLCGSLLKVVAQGGERAGASVIGHLKCHARFAEGTVRANLTSLRTGAECAGDLTVRVAPGGSLSLDLAVLVYGLATPTIDTLVRAALATLAPDATVRTDRGAGPSSGGHLDHRKESTD